MDYSYSRISGTAVGTTSIFSRKGTFKNLVIPAAKTGTVAFYDSASGTSANLVFTMDNNVNAGNVPTSLAIDARMINGLVAVISGTTDVTVIYE